MREKELLDGILVFTSRDVLANGIGVVGVCLRVLGRLARSALRWMTNDGRSRSREVSDGR